MAGGLKSGVTNFGIDPGGSVPPGMAAIACSIPNLSSVYSVSTPALLNFRKTASGDHFVPTVTKERCVPGFDRIRAFFF